MTFHVRSCGKRPRSICDLGVHVAVLCLNSFSDGEPESLTDLHI